MFLQESNRLREKLFDSITARAPPAGKVELDAMVDILDRVLGEVDGQKQPTPLHRAKTRPIGPPARPLTSTTLATAGGSASL